MEKINKELAPHLPDLLFVRFCEEKFGVNRGVYNTIDQWFYMQGIREIVNRRKIILKFLYSLNYKKSQVTKVKFGPKGLTERLRLFFEKQNKDEDAS